MALDNLFSPVTINGLELKNRAVMPAMGTGYGALDGTVTDRLIAYHERRARGGVGLMITEVCAVDPRGKGFPTEIGAWTDDQVPGLKRLASAVHGEASKLALQLHHAGRETFEAFAGATPEAPSAIPSPTMMQPCEEMSQERIGQVIASYASAARRARDAGLDAVEITATSSGSSSPLSRTSGRMSTGGRTRTARCSRSRSSRPCAARLGLTFLC
jgi:2,4-dienoyl-CoA reductase-like NADH-dependent reductase (Old Yellow Enzyme family)